MTNAGSRVLGVDVGGTTMKWTVLHNGRIGKEGEVGTSRAGSGAVVEQIAQIGATAGSVTAVGIGVPGLYEPDGMTTLLPNVPGEWKGFPLGPRVSERLGVPAHLANDVRAFTLAELRLGAGRGCRDLVALALGTGVGGGVVSNGRLHLGHRQRAGEIGHQCVDLAGPRCGCGSRGCVETYASAPAIIAAAARVVLQGVDTRLRDACHGDPARLNVEMVAATARQGDLYAMGVMHHAARALGWGLANACSILAPERIVVGGGVAAALDVLRPTIEDVLRSRAPLPEPPVIVAAELGQLAGAIGAALWSIESEETHT